MHKPLNFSSIIICIYLTILLGPKTVFLSHNDKLENKILVLYFQPLLKFKQLQGVPLYFPTQLGYSLK